MCLEDWLIEIMSECVRNLLVVGIYSWCASLVSCIVADEFEGVVFGVTEEDCFGLHVGEFGFGRVEILFVQTG
jgi:hypothetical protein